MLSAYTHPTSGYSKSAYASALTHGTVWALVLLFHGALLVLLLWVMRPQAVPRAPTPILAQLVQELKPPPPPPAPTPPPQAPKQPPTPSEAIKPEVPPPVATVPVPEIAPAPAPAAITAVQAATPVQQVQASPVPRPAPTPVAKARTVPDSKPLGGCSAPEYPRTSLRMREEGVVELRMLIGTTGKVEQSAVVKSSGHPRLDEAARAALSLCTYKPGTVDGVPEASWTAIKYRWQINED